MTALLPSYDALIHKIQHYRLAMQKQIPLLKDPGLFTGDKVEQAMAAVLDQSLRSTALEECGLDKDDVIFNEQDTIILHDWAQLQAPSTLSMAQDKLDEHNLQSFWRTSDGRLLFAVQYVQYLFISDTKLDIFACFYDFVRDRCIARICYGFFYQDIIGIAKKDVQRQILDGESVNATEICLSVTNGDNPVLTLLNLDTVTLLRERLQRFQQGLARPGVDELEQQLRQAMVLQDNRLQHRPDTIACLEGELLDAKSARLHKEIVYGNTLADNMLNKIRSKLRVHKQLQITNPLNLS